jgi:tRNA pseudouridine32 synthase/23S rRNA pseudouridine746 synthase
MDMIERDVALSLISEESIAGRLLYRDGLMLVLDKPQGIAVHRGQGSGQSLETFFGGLRFGLPRDPALAHRLDRDTSGCLVLGRHHKALEKLGLLFKQGKISKTYWAVVDGLPETDEGLIDLPLGQPSRTRYTVLGRSEGKAFLALEPLTGRTHQLRVHCAALGWPILGDPIYGTGTLSAPSLHLHARSISVPLYKNKEPVAAEAPAPAHMAAALAAFGAVRPGF